MKIKAWEAPLGSKIEVKHGREGWVRPGTDIVTVVARETIEHMSGSTYGYVRVRADGWDGFISILPDTDCELKDFG